MVIWLLARSSGYPLLLPLSGRLVVLPRHSATMNISLLLIGVVSLLLFAPLFEVLLVRGVEHLMVIQVLFHTFFGFLAVF